jgi:hypothetical protein
MGKEQFHYIEVETGSEEEEGHEMTVTQRMSLHMIQSDIRRNLRHR